MSSSSAMFYALSWSYAYLYMHGLLCLPSLLRVLILLGLPLYMPGIPCLPSLLVSMSPWFPMSCLNLLCLLGLLCAYGQPGMYIRSLLWSSMADWSSRVSCMVCQAFLCVLMVPYMAMPAWPSPCMVHVFLVS